MEQSNIEEKMCRFMGKNGLLIKAKTYKIIYNFLPTKEEFIHYYDILKKEKQSLISKGINIKNQIIYCYYYLSKYEKKYLIIY